MDIVGIDRFVAGDECRCDKLPSRLRDAESNPAGGFSGDGVTTYLRGGRDLKVIGGNIEVLENGDIVIDGGQLVAGPTTVDADGVTIGTDVEIDSDGLHVAGGDVRAVEPFRGGDTVGNVSLTTTHSDILSVAVTPPSWAQTMMLDAWLVGFMANSSGGTQRLATSFRVGTEAEFGTINADIPNGLTQVTFNATTMDGVGARLNLPDPFTLKSRAWVTSGSNSANHFKLTLRALFLR